MASVLQRGKVLTTTTPITSRPNENEREVDLEHEKEHELELENADVREHSPAR